MATVRPGAAVGEAAAVWSTSLQPLATNTIDGSTPWWAASLARSRGGPPVGVAVPVDVGDRVGQRLAGSRPAGGSGASLVLSRTATSTWGEW